MYTHILAVSKKLLTFSVVGTILFSQTWSAQKRPADEHDPKPLEKVQRTDSSPTPQTEPINSLIEKAEKFPRADIKDLMSYVAKIDAPDEKGLTQLHASVMKNDANQVELLADLKADVNIPNNNGRTPLQSAVNNKNKELVAYLIQQGAKVNEADKTGITPLSLAAFHDDTEIVTCLIENDAKYEHLKHCAIVQHAVNQKLKNQELLCSKERAKFKELIETQDLNALKDELKKVHTQKAICILSGIGQQTLTDLMLLAIAKREAELLDLALTAGANISIALTKNEEKEPSIFENVVKQKQEDIVSVLLRHGIDYRELAQTDEYLQELLKKNPLLATYSWSTKANKAINVTRSFLATLFNPNSDTKN